MIDEWPEIRKVISSSDMLFDNNYAGLEDLDADEQRVCSLVDGRRSLPDIIDASLLGSFYTCKALVHLLERGAIRLLSNRAESRSRGSFLVKSAMAAGTAAAVALGALLLIALPGGFLESLLPQRSLLHKSLPALRSSAARYSMLKMEKTLYMYYFKNGTYPETAPELVAGGFLSPDDLAYVADGTISYVRTKGSYELSLR
jgi:hypothetical protein